MLQVDENPRKLVAGLVVRLELFDLPPATGKLATCPPCFHLQN